jgi:nucleolar protein 12
MEPSKLKFAKRKLRIQRCKTNTTPSKLGDSNQRVKNSVVAGTAPANGKTASLKLDRKLHKGDPLLGERIKSLSREERKEVKKQDANRLARRMEKKGKRRALDSASRAEKMKDIKERIRVRKTKDALPFKARSRSHQDSKAGRSRKSGKHNQANA